jgi:glycine cleavage system transcriptional repressor
MLVEAPDDVPAAALESALAEAEANFDLTVAVRPLGEGAMIFVEGEPFIVSVYGSDHPGIVHHIATVLADHSVNITDVNTRVLGEEEGVPVYAMLLEVTLPAGMETEDLAAPLRALAAELGVDASVHLADADIL